MFKLFERQINVEKEDFSKEISESCFLITLKLIRKEDTATLMLETRPEDDDGYEVLVSFCVNIDGQDYFVDFDLWKMDEIIFGKVLPKLDLKVRFSVQIHDILSPKSFKEPGPHRNTRVLTSRGECFVSTSTLAEEFGGQLFKDWDSRAIQGESTIVPTNLSEDELDELLKACCGYSKVIINRKSFATLLEVGWRFKITAVLRAVEHYLLAAKSIHPVKKLEYAYNYKFAMLATTVINSLGNRERRASVLEEYLVKENIPFAQDYLVQMLDL